MCLWKSYPGQPGQNFIGSHASEQSEALSLCYLLVPTGLLTCPVGLGRHTISCCLIRYSNTHMKHLAALVWPYVYSEAKHNKWKFSSLDFMAYVMGPGHGFAVMCTDLAKPFLNWNLKIKVSDLGQWLWKTLFSDIKSMLSNKKSRQVLLWELGLPCTLVSPPICLIFRKDGDGLLRELTVISVTAYPVSSSWWLGQTYRVCFSVLVSRPLPNCTNRLYNRLRLVQ